VRLSRPTEARVFSELLWVLLKDIQIDIRVAVRELQISAGRFVRRRRALDRVACAQSLLESMKVAGVAMETWAVV
jgi:hypothetical protein